MVKLNYPWGLARIAAILSYMEVVGVSEAEFVTDVFCVHGCWWAVQLKNDVLELTLNLVAPTTVGARINP